MSAQRAPALTVLGGPPSTTFVFGSSRELVGICAWAMARANDPTPFWLDIRGDDGRPDPGTPAALGWINPDQLFVLSAVEARPTPRVGARTIANVLRADESHEIIAELSEFVMLPSTVQEMIALHTGGGTRPAFVIANVDRVRSEYPTDPAGVRRILDVLVHQGVLPIFTSTPPPGPGRRAFDFVFEVRAADRRHWRGGELICEKAPDGSGFRTGSSVRLEDLPEVANSIQGRPSA
ncbi:MAG: hypothetical protein L3J91_00595 [Thermoplasmata archaeon]|nr:hypothetical protein [Thermoplasmata archaeon]